MKIYTGQIRNLYVKNVEISDKVLDVVTDSMALRKNALFYRNFTGRLISFEYGTYLPTFYEAESFVNGVIERNPKALECATCVYACYGDMEEKEVSKEVFKSLKKTYRNIRKEKRNR